MNNFKKAQIVCKYLPPILAQTVRNIIISTNEGETLALNFTKKSITGGYFTGNTGDFHALKFGVHGFFDWRNIILVNKILKFRRGNIIEIGANIGTETISLADIAGKYDLQVFAFEPVPENFKYLKILKEKNNFSHLKLFEKLVSDKEGFADFRIPEGNDSGSGYMSEIKKEINSQKFEVTTVDVEMKNTDSCAVILVDVEGFEYQVLCGSLKTIRKYRPFLIIEVNRNYLEKRGKVKLQDLKAFLDKNKYIPFYIGRFGIEKVDILDFKVMPNKNWICIPVEELKSIKTISRSICINAFNLMMSNFIF